MYTGLPSLYRRGRDVFGCRKSCPPPPLTNRGSNLRIPPRPPPTVNDLLVFGIDEIDHIKTIRDSLQRIKKDTTAQPKAPPRPMSRDDETDENSYVELDLSLSFLDSSEEEDESYEPVFVISPRTRSALRDCFPIVEATDREMCVSPIPRLNNDQESIENSIINSIQTNIKIDEALSFVSSMVNSEAQTMLNNDESLNQCGIIEQNIDHASGNSTARSRSSSQSRSRTRTLLNAETHTLRNLSNNLGTRQ